MMVLKRLCLESTGRRKPKAEGFPREVFNHLIAVNIVNLSIRMFLAEGVEEGLEASHLKVPAGV